MSTQPVLSDLDMGSVARIRNLLAPVDPDEPVRNDDARLSGTGAPVGSASPLMNGTAAAGASANASREDHVHPSDTSRASQSQAIAYALIF